MRWVGGSCLLGLGAGIAAGGLATISGDTGIAKSTGTGLVLGVAVLPVAGCAVIISGAIKPHRDRADLAFRRIERMDYSTPDASLRRERAAEAALRRLAMTSRFDRILTGTLGVAFGAGCVFGPLMEVSKGGSALSLLMVPVGISCAIPLIKIASQKNDYEIAYESFLSNRQRSP